jgi:hypothetical protein
LIKTKIVAAFPGTGKTWAASQTPRIYDCDSPPFFWLDGGIRINIEFPYNYVDHIVREMDNPDYDYILVSCQKAVLQDLHSHDIPYTLVLPNNKLKEEYLQRIKDRGSSESLYKAIDKNWSTILFKAVTVSSNREIIILDSNEYLFPLLDENI